MYLCSGMSKICQLIGISSAMHLLVDGVCICCMFLLAEAYGDYLGAYGDRVSMGAILVYNILAFMSQPLTGLMADRMAHRHWLLLSSVLLLTVAVAIAWLVMSNMSLAGKMDWLIQLVALPLGVGNSLFHVWGGKQTVVKTGNDIRALGVFVSTGALGLAIGFVFCSWALLYVLLLAFVGLSVLYVRWDDGASKAVEDIRGNYAWLTPLTIWTLVIMLMLCVCYRSFAGEVFSKGITKTQSLILVIGAVAMLGKMAGGWIVRWVGLLPSVMVILAGVALCFLFRGNLVWVLLLGIFLMNCTMPITLYLANLLLPKREGLAFGLLAAALIPGYLLAVYL
jgi:hypothetical protein